MKRGYDGNFRNARWIDMLKFLFTLLLLFSRLAFADARNWDSHGYSPDFSNAGGTGIIVLFLGALHALPILLVAMKTKNKTLTWLTACGMAFIGLVLGGAAFALVDLFFVGIGLWAALALHTGKEFRVTETKVPTPMEQVTTEKRRRLADSRRFQAILDEADKNSRIKDTQLINEIELLGCVLN